MVGLGRHFVNQITHNYPWDLTVELVDPSGAKATLARGISALSPRTYLGCCFTPGEIEGTWGTSSSPGTVTETSSCTQNSKRRPRLSRDGPLEDLDAFLGDEGTGQWKLTISDGASGDGGNLDYWRVNLTC